MDRPSERAPWYLRVVPVVSLALLVVAALAVVLPGFRDQLTLSTSRQHHGHVELYLAEHAGRGSACDRRHGSVVVGFVVRSHLRHRKALRYRVALDPEHGSMRPHTTAGKVGTKPGRPSHVTVRIGFPAGRRFVARVDLPGRDQHLEMRCPAGRRKAKR